MKKCIILIWILCLAVTFQAAGQDKITKAKELMQQGKPGEVVSLLQNTVLTDVQYREALLLLGNAFLQLGKLDSAESHGKDLLAFNDRNIDAILIVVPALAGQKKFAEAYGILKKGMKASKNNPLLLVELGNTHMKADSVEQAIVAFSQAKEADPKSIQPYIGLGEAYQKLQADAVAILQYEEAVSIDSLRLDLKTTLARLYQKEQRYNDAAGMYMDVIRGSKDKVQPSLELGSLYFKAKQYGNAAKVLANYVKVHPENAETWKMFVESVDAGKTFDVGLSIADSILLKQPANANALKLAGKCSMITGKSSKSSEKHQTAIAHFTKLKTIQPLDAEDIKYLGRAHFELKNDSLAILNLEKSLSSDSTQSEIYMDLGFAYMRKKDWPNAARMFQKKFLQDTTFASAYVNYALCEEQLSNWELSRRSLQKALAQAPNFLLGHYHLAYTYQSMDSVQAAKREYGTVITLVDTAKTRYKNEIGSAYRYLAFAGLLEKNYKEALDAIEKALEFRPKDIELLLWHAQTLHSMNRRDEARTEYERIIKLAPKSKEAKDAKEKIDRLDLGF
jgi:tetratricopeptide (TPR) repeat protein